MALISKGINPLLFQGLKTTITSEESKMINFNDKPKVIISASGMCEAGRIRHHLKHNLWKRMYDPLRRLSGSWHSWPQACRKQTGISPALWRKCRG